MTAPPAAVDGHTAPPDPAAEAVSRNASTCHREKDPDRLKNTWQDPVKQTEARLKPPLLQQEEQPPPLQKPQEAARQPPQHPPGSLVWPAVLTPPPASGQESQVIARLTASDSGQRATASGHANLPSGQGNAYADGATGSGQTTTTGHGVQGVDPRIETGHNETESSHAASGSSQKTATAPGASGHEKRAKRTKTGVDALELLTANGKRRESDNHGDVHESYSYVTRPSYPSLHHDPKIENHGRITHGGKTTKSPSNSHVVERAVRIGERQRSRRRGKRESTASGQLPLCPLPKEKEKRERGHLHPSRSTQIEREGRKPPHRQKTPGAPWDPSCIPCPPKGREEEEEEVVPGSETPEEVSARGEVGGAEGTEPEGREDVLRIASNLLTKRSHWVADPIAQMSQNMSLAQTLPLHLVQVGWVSRSINDRKAPPSYLPPLGKSI